MDRMKTLEGLHKKFGSKKTHSDYKPDTSQRHPMLRGKFKKDSHGIKDKALKAKM